MVYLNILLPDGYEDNNINLALAENLKINGYDTSSYNGKDSLLIDVGSKSVLLQPLFWGFKGDAQNRTPGDTMSWRAFPTYTISTAHEKMPAQRTFDYWINPQWSGDNIIPPPDEIGNPVHYKWIFEVKFKFKSNFKPTSVLTIPFKLTEIMLGQVTSPYKLNSFRTIYNKLEATVKVRLYSITEPNQMLNAKVSILGSGIVEGGTIEYMNIPQYVDSGIAGASISAPNGVIALSESFGMGQDVTPPTETWVSLDLYSANGNTCLLGWTKHVVWENSADNKYYTTKFGSTLVSGTYSPHNKSGLGDKITLQGWNAGSICDTEVVDCDKLKLVWCRPNN